MVEKVLVYTVTIVVTALVTFFGLGPVIYADGSMSERMVTLAVVIVIYLVIGTLFGIWLRRQKTK